MVVFPLLKSQRESRCRYSPCICYKRRLVNGGFSAAGRRRPQPFFLRVKLRIVDGGDGGVVTAMGTDRAVASWREARKRWEAGGVTFADIARAMGVTRAAVSYRARREMWKRVVVSGSAVQERADVLAAGDSPSPFGLPPVEQLQVEYDAVDLRARLIQAHRREWREHAQAFSLEAIADQGVEYAKLAKLTAETILLRQRGERIAWGLEDDPQGRRTEEVVIEWLNESPGAFSCDAPRSTPLS